MSGKTCKIAHECAVARRSRKAAVRYYFRIHQRYQEIIRSYPENIIRKELNDKGDELGIKIQQVMGMKENPAFFEELIKLGRELSIWYIDCAAEISEKGFIF